MARCGATHGRMAGILRMSPSAFSQAFSDNYEDRNRVMKHLALGQPGRSSDDEALLRSVTREYVALLADALGLSIGHDPDGVELCRRYAEATVDLLRHWRVR